ncbi:MAG: hypothetical protein RL094_298 [Candidatus Parcubacteria bacterium]|jgi:phenylalanyl-tRNA synthetase beta chain
MNVSYKWLQQYFKHPLPATQKVADVFTMGVFEIESVEEKNGDTVFDIKTLADRNPYALSHRYMALELGVLLGQEVTFPTYNDVATSDAVRALSVTVHDADFCHRYVGRVVEGVQNGPSPAWLKSQLEVLGQRSINTIVDLTNYVMLDTGQPLHAFDADKVKGNIHVRKAKDAEEITLLDGTVVKLTSDMFVIADDESALAIAGVKGGKKAEVTIDTKNIILEAATFNGSMVRRTAQTVNIRNDSTKRFENQITPERALLAMTELSALIAKESGAAVFGSIVDQYPRPQTEWTIVVKVSDINTRLGIDVAAEEIIRILKAQHLTVVHDGDKLSLTIPLYRSDLIITEDIVDEVGRIYGYDKVKGELPPVVDHRPINKDFYYHNLIRKTLIELGFSEIYTYTLQDVGDVALQNPLNVHRGFMRNDLTRAMEQKLDFNLRNIDLLGLGEVKLFEIGKVFGGAANGSAEKYALSFGVKSTKPVKLFDPKQVLTDVLQQIAHAVGIKDIQQYVQFNADATVVELSLVSAIEALPEPTSDIEFPKPADISYKPFSSYPFAVRDIAVFVPGEKGSENAVLDIIKSESGDLLVRSTLFDTFTKTFKETGEVKTSYAYRLVFQAEDRTLNEDDLNGTMKRITDKMNAHDGWQVR